VKVQGEGSASEVMAALSELDAHPEVDVIVIAGKGHENYQIIGDKTLHFSDQEVAEAYLTKK